MDSIKKTILEFVSELKNVLPPDTNFGRRAGADLHLVEFFFKHMSSDVLSEHVVKEVLPHSDQIKTRNEIFFLNNGGIFGGISKDKVHEISSAWTNGVLSKEDKDVIWEYFDTLVALAKKHHATKTRKA